MSWRGAFSAWSRLSRLNACSQCGHTWYARGHRRSRSCPSCRAQLPAADAPQDYSGCGIALLVLVGVVGAFMAFGVTVQLFGQAAIPVDLAALGVVGVSGWAIRRAWRQSAERDRLAQEEETRQLAQQQQDAYWRRLVSRYGHENASRILGRRIWQGATQEMVVEILGQPGDVARRVFKTKTKETWKYRPLGARRWGLHVTFEDGVCVGWDEKA